MSNAQQGKLVSRLANAKPESFTAVRVLSVGRGGPAPQLVLVALGKGSEAASPSEGSTEATLLLRTVEKGEVSSLDDQNALIQV